MKYFCAKCGKTTLYSFELPKFCSSCGTSLSSKLESNHVAAQRDKFLNELKLKKINNTNTQEDNHQIHPETFKKVKPSFKLDVYQNKGESLGSILDNPSKPIDNIHDQNMIPQKTKEEILSEFKKEAGSLRSE